MSDLVVSSSVDAQSAAAGVVAASDAVMGANQFISFAIGEDLAQAIINADQKAEHGIAEQRERVRILKDKLAALKTAPRPARIERPV